MDNYSRILIKQLYKEHQNICWSYKLKLKNVLFDITSAESFWGQYDSHTSTISLSKKLILNYSWSKVIDVLKHEIAHQIVFEIFGSEDSHGILFKKACDIIDVPEAMRRSLCDLEHLPNENEHEDHITIKVKKLLSLATSDNEHEAFLAMKKANELMFKYNISRIKNNSPCNYSYKIINLKKKRIPGHIKKICSILINHFFVEVVFSSEFCSKDLTVYKTIELLGTNQNIMMADHVFNFLVRELEYLFKATIGKGGVSKKRSFFLGVLRGFEKKLENIVEVKSNSLIRADEKKLSIYVRKRFPRLCSVKNNTSNLYLSYFNAGMKEGRKIVINKCVTKKETTFGGLLC